MPAFSGTFSGNVSMQSAVNPVDQPNHQIHLAEVRGIQKSPDEKWNNSAITYWGVTDLIEDQGVQRGYFHNLHTNGDADFGTFEGKVTAKAGELLVEGTWKTTNGTGQLKGMTGSGTFKTRSTLSGTVEASWQGNYELAGAKAAGR